MRIALSTMLAIAMQSGAAYLPNNWTASGTTNSSLPGTAYMDSVQVTNNITGTGPLVFGANPIVVRPQFSNYFGIVGSSSFDGTIFYGTTNATGQQYLRLGASQVGIDNALGIGTGTSGPSGPDLILGRESAATLQLGSDAAAPVNQVLKAADGSGTDKPGAQLTLKGGYGTGTARGGDIITMTSVSSNTTGAVVQYYSTRHYESAKPAPVTNSAACPLFNILVNTNHYLACKIFASTFASDVGGDFQAFAEELNICAVNKAGTIASTVSTSWGTNLAASSASTLTTTWTGVTSGNSLDIKITPVSSLTPTTYYTKWKVDILSNDPATITPQ